VAFALLCNLGLLRISCTGAGDCQTSLTYLSESFEPPTVSTARGPPGGRWYVGAVHGEPELAHAVAAIDAALTKLF